MALHELVAANRPPLLQPGGGAQGFDSLSGYKLRNEPGFPAGRIIPDNGGRDFFGNPVPANRAPTIGVFEQR